MAHLVANKVKPPKFRDLFDIGQQMGESLKMNLEHFNEVII